jgi:hypothetical protein
LPPQLLPTEQWEANKAELARHLDDDTWDALAPFQDSVPTTRTVVERDVERGVATIPPFALPRIEEARDLAAGAYSLLTDGGSPDRA